MATYLLMFAPGAWLVERAVGHTSDEINLEAMNAPPFSRVNDELFVLGSDMLGRDLLVRFLHGGRRTLTLALAALASSVAIGFALGRLARRCRHNGVARAAVVAAMTLPGLVWAAAFLVPVATWELVDPGERTRTFALLTLFGITAWAWLAERGRASPAAAIVLLVGFVWAEATLYFAPPGPEPTWGTVLMTASEAYAEQRSAAFVVAAGILAFVGALTVLALRVAAHGRAGKGANL